MRRTLLFALLAVPAAVTWAEAPGSSGSVGSTPIYDRTIASESAEILPSWLKLSGEFRVRAEGRTGFGYQPDNNDTYGLFRTRVNVELIPAPWLDFFLQGQDSRSRGWTLDVLRRTFAILSIYARHTSASVIRRGW